MTTHRRHRERGNLIFMDAEREPRELGSVVLGSGEFRLALHWIIDRSSLMLINEDNSGGGTECSDRLTWVLGRTSIMSRTRDSGPFQVHGEVAAGYNEVSLICRDGSQVDSIVLDCIEVLGFNVHVAEVPSFPLRTVASNDSGHAVSMLIGQPSFWTHETPEAAALDGWPTASQVRVRSVTVHGDRAEVVVDTDHDWPSWVYCVRTRGRWHEAIAENGPTTEWDDPWPDPMSPPPPGVSGEGHGQ